MASNVLRLISCFVVVFTLILSACRTSVDGASLDDPDDSVADHYVAARGFNVTQLMSVWESLKPLLKLIDGPEGLNGLKAFLTPELVTPIVENALKGLLGEDTVAMLHPYIPMAVNFLLKLLKDGGHDAATQGPNQNERDGPRKRAEEVVADYAQNVLYRFMGDGNVEGDRLRRDFSDQLIKKVVKRFF